MPDPKLFEDEIATYEREKEALLAEHEHEYVLIKGDSILGIFQTEDEAIEAGYEQLGNVLFLARQIERVDPVIYLSDPYLAI